MWIIIGYFLVACVVSMYVTWCAYADDGFTSAGIVACAALLVTLFSGVLVVLLGGQFGGVLPNYSSGTEIGYIQSVDSSGIVWKTNHVQLSSGPAEVTGGQRTIGYSVPDGELFALCQRYVVDNKRVRIRYDGWFVAPAWIGNHDRVLKSIEVDVHPPGS